MKNAIDFLNIIIKTISFSHTKRKIDQSLSSATVQIVFFSAQTRQFFSNETFFSGDVIAASESILN